MRGRRKGLIGGGGEAENEFLEMFGGEGGELGIVVDDGGAGGWNRTTWRGSGKRQWRARRLEARIWETTTGGRRAGRGVGVEDDEEVEAWSGDEG